MKVRIALDKPTSTVVGVPFAHTGGRGLATVVWRSGAYMVYRTEGRLDVQRLD